jgi:galactose mutarotase-like enzyme
MHELRLQEGPIEVVVVPEAGARLHRLRAFGEDLLRTPDDPERSGP